MSFLIELAWAEAVSRALTLGRWPHTLLRSLVWAAVSAGPLVLFHSGGQDDEDDDEGVYDQEADF